jgi:SAM-dependent methyltransferase
MRQSSMLLVGKGGYCEHCGVTHRRRVMGCELSLTRAALVGAENFPVAVADCLRFPFETASIGLPILRHVIEHLHDDSAALREVRRVLRPNGFGYLETPLRLRGASYLYRNQDGRRVLCSTHVREYQSMEQVQALVEAAGLETIAAGAYPLRHAFGLLAHRLVHLLLRPSPRTTARLQRLYAVRRPAFAVPRYREIRLLARSP